jgi:ATP-binding cassette subfamily A (ABC1) protein 3
MFFTNYSTAQISIMAANFLSGFVTLMCHIILIRIKGTRDLDAILVNIFRIFPSYNVGEGMLNVAINYYRNTLLDRNVSAFAWTVTGRNISIMCIEGLLFISLVLLSESECWFNIKRLYEDFQLGQLKVANLALSMPEIDEDIDVSHERIAVERANKNRTAVMLQAVHQVYALPWTASHLIEYLLDKVRCIFGQPVTESYRMHYKYAVKDFNLCVPVGECFGLLGVNGAGKTSTMNILTGDAIQSTGEALIYGQPLHNSIVKYFVGYCPQVDPLFELMTAWELLTFYGRIRGDVNGADLQARVAKLIETVGLSAHAHKPCGVYSGGNKRKLSLAIALIGDPPILLLDEVIPSTLLLYPFSLLTPTTMHEW